MLWTQSVLWLEIIWRKAPSIIGQDTKKANIHEAQTWFEPMTQFFTPGKNVIAFYNHLKGEEVFNKETITQVIT